MGIVIAWPGPSRSSAPAGPAKRQQATPGEIILFLGVRYERHAERSEPPGTTDTTSGEPAPGRKGKATPSAPRERRRRRG